MLKIKNQKTQRDFNDQRLAGLDMKIQAVKKKGNDY
jgi:hypothetical protein